MDCEGKDEEWSRSHVFWAMETEMMCPSVLEAGSPQSASWGGLSSWFADGRLPDLSRASCVSSTVKGSLMQVQEAPQVDVSMPAR